MSDHPAAATTATHVAAGEPCPECGTVPPADGAGWCGRCGALLDPDRVGPRRSVDAWDGGRPFVTSRGPTRGGTGDVADLADGLGERPSRPGEQRPRARAAVGWIVVAIVTGGVAMTAGSDAPVAEEREPAPARSDRPPSVVATTPIGTIPRSPVVVAVGEGVVALRGGPIVAVDDGRTVGSGLRGRVTTGRTAAAIVGDDLVLTDVTTGVTIGRHELATATGRGRRRLVGWGGGGLVATVGDDLVGLATDGVVRWQEAGAAREDVTVVPGADWAVGTDADGIVVVRDLRDGSVAWTVGLDDPSGAASARLVDPPESPPVVVLVDGDEVVGHEPADGTELWRVQPAPSQDPSAPHALRLADADDVVAVLVARMSENSSRVLMLDPTSGSVRTRVLGPVPTSPLDLLDGQWTVDARGAAVLGTHGVTTTRWRHDPNLLLVEDVVEVGVADEALVLVRGGVAPALEVRDRGDHELLSTFAIVPG